MSGSVVIPSVSSLLSRFCLEPSVLFCIVTDLIDFVMPFLYWLVLLLSLSSITYRNQWTELNRFRLFFCWSCSLSFHSNFTVIDSSTIPERDCFLVLVVDANSLFWRAKSIRCYQVSSIPFLMIGCLVFESCCAVILHQLVLLIGATDYLLVLHAPFALTPYIQYWDSSILLNCVVSRFWCTCVCFTDYFLVHLRMCFYRSAISFAVISSTLIQYHLEWFVALYV